MCVCVWITLRIAHLRIAHWGAILRWAILSPSVIRIAHPSYYVFLWIVCAWYGPWVNTGDTPCVFDHNILKNKVFRAIWGDILTRTVEKSQMNATNGQPKMMHRSSSRTGHLSTRLKTHSEEKPEKCNQCYLYPIRQAIWGDVFKDSVEKSQTNVTSVIIHLLVHTIWRHI